MAETTPYVTVSQAIPAAPFTMPDLGVHDPRSGCSRWAIPAFTTPIWVFTTPISAFTMPRSRCSRSRDLGVHDGPIRAHPVLRRRFSFAHELAHVVLDHDGRGAISRHSNQDALIEVRANAFAAAFLMPAEGVRALVASLGKGQPSRGSAEVFDGDEAIHAEGRVPPGSQEIQLYDVAQLAHHLGVSRVACLYRLQNLKVVAASQAEQLRQSDRARGKALARRLGLPDPEEHSTRDWFQHRFLGLALEAYRRQEISRGKLEELAGLIGMSSGDVDALLEDAGLAPEEPSAPLVPAG